MARAVIQLAAIATCVVLSLTAEDRQARSGDLDRGPSLKSDIQRTNLFGEEQLSYPYKVEEISAEKLSADIVFHSPAQGVATRQIYNKEWTNSKQQPHFDSRNFQDPINDREAFFIPLSGSENLETIKTDSSLESETLSAGVRGNVEIQNFDELKSNRHVKSSSKNILNQLQNLRFKIPFYENASPQAIADTSQDSLEPESSEGNVKAASEQHKNKSKVTPEIYFEDFDESAMALRRRFEMSTEFFIVPSSSVPPVTSTSAVHVTKNVYAGEPGKIGGVFRNEVWVVPVLALSAITMLMIAGFEIFVLCKAWRTTPSRRHLFLGQMLLLGLFACASLASVFAASPTQFTCALMRFGTGVAYAIVFASLLVKCVFLISLNGGVYLPAPYQGLLLLFAILIQVAIGVQWLMTSPALVDAVTVEHIVQQNKNRLLVTAADISTSQVIPLCRTPYMDMLLSLIYVIFLIIFVTVLAVKSRGIRDNYREATYIGLSVGCSIPTWLIWTISGLVVNERHRDACIAFGLVITSIMVFLIMFMPKGRQLAAMGKEGVYLEDREERFSSLSRAGSGYSPSFFHFKPIKYGMNHGTKHQPIATLTAGGKKN